MKTDTLLIHDHGPAAHIMNAQNCKLKYVTVRYSAEGERNATINRILNGCFLAGSCPIEDTADDDNH